MSIGRLDTMLGERQRLSQGAEPAQDVGVMVQDAACARRGTPIQHMWMNTTNLRLFPADSVISFTRDSVASFLIRRPPVERPQLS